VDTLFLFVLSLSNIDGRRKLVGTLVRRYAESDEAFYRRLILPEEQRRLLTTAKWDGSFRWFRSPNVIPFEKYRRPGPADSNQQVA
jgi:hypothetical protein